MDLAAPWSGFASNSPVQNSILSGSKEHSGLWASVSHGGLAPEAAIGNVREWDGPAVLPQHSVSYVVHCRKSACRIAALGLGSLIPGVGSSSP
jgi:hypothetical protein